MHPLELSKEDYEIYIDHQIRIMRDKSIPVQKRMKQLIYNAGYSIDEFAEACGVSISAVKYWTGMHKCTYPSPSVRYMNEVAKRLVLNDTAKIEFYSMYAE